MPLTLTVLRCPPAVVPETRTVTGGELTVGRGPGVDWVLPDPDQVVSRLHFTASFRGGGWLITDKSSNGTFTNRDESPIGKGNAQDLRDHDRLRVGPYEIEVSIAEADAPRRSDYTPASAKNRFDDPFADPLGADPLANHPRGFGHRAAGQSGAAHFGTDPLGDDPFGVDPFADPLRPVDRAPVFGTPFAGGTRDDHRPVGEDAFQPPMPIGHMPMNLGGQIPADDLLGDDWDNLLEDIAAPAPPAAASRPSFAPAPPVPAPIAEPAAPSAVTPAPSASPPFAATPFATEARNDPPVVPVPVDASDSPLMDVFLAGVGLPAARPADPAATMLRLGEAFRAMVSGLRAVLIARATIKSEFRIEQTLIRPRGNNPLKFSADDDDAVSALLGVGRRSDVAPAAAVADALRDIRLHELASMAAMQAAMRAVMDGLAPDKIRASVDQGGLSMLPGQRKARQWDAYEALHARTVQALSDDFDSVFGKAFARAYEDALEDLASREKS